MTNTLFDLTGQVALVTGTSRGLGQYFARALANAGADLILTSRRKDDLLPFVAEIEALGRRAVPLALDVRDQQSIAAMAEAAEASYGRIDILVNNAGCNVRKPAFDVTWDDWNLILDTNLRGSFFVAQQIAQRMVSRGYGRIVNIGSVTSVFGYAGLAPYGASRGGIRQLTMSLADDWGRHGITVNCLGAPHDLDGAIVFLASEASRYITGQTLLVDGGISTGSTRATVAPPPRLNPIAKA